MPTSNLRDRYAFLTTVLRQCLENCQHQCPGCDMACRGLPEFGPGGSFRPQAVLCAVPKRSV